MKKFLSVALVAMMVLSMTTAAFAATGVGSATSVKVTAASADKAGSVAVDTYMCAVTVDENPQEFQGDAAIALTGSLGQMLNFC